MLREQTSVKTRGRTYIGEKLSVMSGRFRINHMFYPSGGGNTITAVSTIAEKGMAYARKGQRSSEIFDLNQPKYSSRIGCRTIKI